jgi:hypothetical protein
MAANFVVDLLPLQKGYRQLIRLAVIAIDMGCAIKFGRVFG